MPGAKQVFMALLTSSSIDLKAIETKQNLVMLASECLSRKQLEMETQIYLNHMQKTKKQKLRHHWSH